MTSRLISACLLLVTTSFGALELPNRSISSSGQFVVYANDADLRSKVSMKAEDYKEAFRALLGIRDEWKLTIILNLGTPPPNTKNPPKSQIGLFEADGGALKIQIDVFDLSFLKHPAFDSQLISAILLEYAYRGSSVKAGRSFEKPPAWVTDAILERVQARDEGHKSSIYATLLASGQTPGLGEFFNTRPENLDSTSRAIFRAQALAMLDAILELPDAKPGLRGYLGDPRRSPSDAREIVRWFPSLAGDRDALGRKWVLAIARASAADRVDLLDRRDTATELDRILDIKALPDPRNPKVAALTGPYALEPIARSQNGRFILVQKGEELLRLSIRSHPIYKPLVDEYLRIVRELTAKPKRRVDKQIAEAEKIRAGLRGESSERESYLDWVEATKVKTESEQFTNLIEDVEKIEQAPERTDAISRYLDAVAERGW